MKTNRAIVIPIVVLIAAAGLLIYYFSNLTRWDENYLMNNSQPYGTEIIYKLLKSRQTPDGFHEITKLGDSTIVDFTNKGLLNYVFIGDSYYADSTGVKQLLDFVAKGNTAFISAQYFPNEIASLVRRENTDLSGDEKLKGGIFGQITEFTVSLNFPGHLHRVNDFPVSHIFNDNYIQWTWSFFDSTIFSGNKKNIFVEGTINHEVNFIKINYGFGNLLLHFTPIALTNYNIISNHGREYSESILSLLNEGGIIWDEYDKFPKYNYHNENNNDDQGSRGPLSFILGRDSLRWAWYLILSLSVIFLVFYGKRRQRSIPVLESNKNTSLGYIKTVGKLYYLQRDHRAVCIYKMKHFQSFLRNRYFIVSTQRNDEMAEKISMVSGIKKEIIQNIFNRFALFEINTEITDDELIDFHNMLTGFYKNCN